MARTTMTLCVALLVALAATVAGQTVDVKTVSMKVLVLGVVPVDDPTVGGIRGALEGRGMPYDYINVLHGYSNNEPLPLVGEGGRGKYYGIVKLSHNLAYEAEPGFWPSALSETQWAQIDEYQLAYNIRVMNVHSWPFFDGVTYLATGAKEFMEFTDEAREFDAAMAADARITLEGSYVTPAALVTPASLENDQDHHFTAMGFFYPDESSDTPDGVACAVQTNPDTGAETWHYFFVPTHYFAGQTAAMSLGLNWLVRGMFLGKRRMYLSMQIDDLYLSTGEWSVEFAGNPDQSIRPQVRTTAEELALLKADQEWLTSLLPEGSHIQYEFAYNGNGVLLASPDACPDEYTVCNQACVADALCKQTRTNKNDFWWLTHTFTHPFLNNYTYEECKWELSKNWDAAHVIWGNNLPSTHGMNEMVNPAITGLFNGECLRAMKDEGIVTAVGDNSRAELIPSNLYHGLWTTAAKNGYDGTFIIPRWATNIFFDNSEPDYNLAHFHHITEYKTWTWRELMEYEASSAARALLQLRPDPFMFHQANVHEFTFTKDFPAWPDNHKASLMTVWTKAVIDKLNKYNAFPVRSVQEKKMREELEERMNRDACGIDAWQVLENGIATRVHATSTGHCRLALSGVSGANPTMDSETYGTQNGGERTVFADMAGSEVVIETGLVFKPTCPKVDGELCSGNGHCDAQTNPPKCVCDTGYSGYNCSTLTLSYAGNLVANAGFESGTATTANSWSAFGSGYHIGTANNGDNGRYITMYNADLSEAHGAAQMITVGQQYATAIRIKGRSRPHSVSGHKDANYAIYVDAVYDDGSWQYGLTAQFDPAQDGVWHEASIMFTPHRPVTYLWVYCMFRHHTGTADFDDIAAQEAADLVDDSVLSDDGRCGSQSPINAACPNGECCSTFGYCGTTEDHCTYQDVDDVVEEESKPVTFKPKRCRRCRRRSRGPCKHPNGWCTGLTKEKNQCPAGTVLCDDAPAFSRGIRPWIIKVLRTRGLRRRAWSRAIRRRFRRGFARACGVDDESQVDIAFVADDLNGQDSSRVELVVVANEGQTGEEMAAAAHDAVISGSVDAELAANAVGGVHAEEDGEARIEYGDDDSITSGTGLAIMLGAVAVASVLGMAVGAVVMRRFSKRRGSSSSRVVRLDDQAVWGNNKGGHMPVSQLSDSAPKSALAVNSDSEGDDASDYSSAVEGMDRRRVSQRQLIYKASARRSSAGSRFSGANSVVMMDEPQLLGTPRASVVEDVRGPSLTTSGV